MSTNENQSKQTPMNHNYDGIQELDNPLPGWWLATFYITVVFSVFYYLYYQMGSGPSLVQEYEQSVTEQDVKDRSKPKAPAPKDDELLAMASDGAKKSAGQAIFATRCASCHADKGQGNIGPNLTDSYWIHGGKISNIYKVVSEGVLEKGMPAWSAVLKPEELNNVVAFVWSLKGTNVPGGKAPQGNKE